LRRTQADKRRAVERLLKDPEWAQWSDRKIAEAAKIDHKTVGAIRRELAGEFPTGLRRGGGEFPTANGSQSNRRPSSLTCCAPSPMMRCWRNAAVAVSRRLAMLDYQAIKTMAKQIGRPVKHLLALSSVNDPFYAGVGARREAAEWFAALWQGQWHGQAHLRRLLYQLVSSDKPIIKPDGREFQNTEGDWTFLCSASLSARYLDLVPFDGLVDRRNGEPMIFAANLDADPNEKLEASCSVSGEEPYLPEIAIPGMPSLPWLHLDVDRPVQKFIVEVWIEKSTQNDWLVPLCQRRGVNLVVGIGEQSEIRSRELALRSAKYGAPVRVLYLSDFDPGGRSMPKAVARKVEFTLAKFGLNNVDLQLIPLALTPEQCRFYKLPRIPIKESERRRDKFEATFGIGATELDALEALHPGELARLLNDELDRWLDRTLGNRFAAVQADLQLGLRKIEERVYEKYAAEIAELEGGFAEIVGDFEEVSSQFDDWDDHAAELYATIAAELRERRPDLSAVEVPRSEAPGATDRFVLFDSKRDFTQMDHYNFWRDGVDE
jgi:hypothetical protein